MSVNKFPVNSRYCGVPTVEATLPDGRPVVFLRRRFLPAPERFSVITAHLLRQDERLDHVAAAHLGDAEQSWRLADANGALHPRELVEPGRALNITLPEGIPGLPTE